MEYQPIIGLEIHSELKTQTKMFCDCLNDPEEKHPNTNICPVCVGHPGTLPVANLKAVEAVLKLGFALNSRIPKDSKFDRKNYFYPDLPKGYQISQYDKPLALGGALEIKNQKSNIKIRITRIHLEEDTARLQHSEDGKSSLVDFNRAGVPLMELVTEPDLRNAEDTVKFAKELQLILRYLEISDADMEKGQFRVEVNISLSPENPNNKSQIPNKLGTKVEIKNLNSFRVVGEAIDYEIRRQGEALEKGEVLKQETRGWDDAKKRTVSQRSKEDSHDYRYFPEPDLPLLDLTKLDLEAIKVSVPELPAQKRIRFAKEYGLSDLQTEILIGDRWLAKFFEESMSEFKLQIPNPKSQTLVNYLTSDLMGLMNKEGVKLSELKINPEDFSELVFMVEQGELSSRMAKNILLEMYKTGLDPHEIIKEQGISQVSDRGAIELVVKEVIDANPKAVADYKKGKENALAFLMGQSMAKLKGQGNPKVLIQTLKKIINL
ncbi:MAG: Asp-tRNA(Asn)/Glu-tRNA(Gln) amidotransferase subunit GatB [Candidatus Wolfebacteria bacterium]|nr:Asp-tRNA(Asn)/Glu-tRNA(Gln) amidotransferase subunit GatB [Candidatus Wolfebacteria bacterium]